MKELQWIEELKRDCESGEQGLFPPKWDFKDLDGYPTEEIRKQVRLSRERAEGGDLDEIWALADYYTFGSEKLKMPRNFKKAIYWLKKAAEHRSECRGAALWRLAQCYIHSRGKNRDGKKAYEILKALATIDCSKIELPEEAEFAAKAEISLAHCYDKGIGTEKDLKKAFAIWEEYAEKPDETACYNLGVAYLKNSYVKRNYEKAFYWTKKAVELGGGAKAVNNLGWCYEKGYGTAKDIKKAIEYYKEAASCGNRVARNNLKRIKELGIVEE